MGDLLLLTFYPSAKASVGKQLEWIQEAISLHADDAPDRQAKVI